MKVRGIFCLNSKCKHYFEDSCVKILQDDSIDVSEGGRCVSFEAVVCEGYKEYPETPEESAWDKIQSYIVSCNYTWTHSGLKHDYQKYYMKGFYCSHTFLDVVRNNEPECKLLFGEKDHEQE